MLVYTMDINTLLSLTIHSIERTTMEKTMVRIYTLQLCPHLIDLQIPIRSQQAMQILIQHEHKILIPLKIVMI